MKSSHYQRWPNVRASFLASARRQARQLRLLQEASHQIAAALEVDVVLERVVQAISSSFGYPFVTAALVEDGYLVTRHMMAPPHIEGASLPSKLPLNGNGLTVWAVQNAQAVVCNDVGSDSRFISPSELSSTRSELVVPLRGRFAVLGIIDLQAEYTNAFDDEDLELISTLAEYTTTAIENARLYAAARERSRELEQRYQNERMLLADMEHSYNELLHTLTELERRDEQLRRTERLSALGELASGIAHDFNNLLAGILGNTQLLLFDETEAERRRMLGVIEQAAQDGATTVRRIQEFARQSEHHEREAVNLSDVIDGAIAITRPRWHNLTQREGRPITLQREVGQTLRILGNAAELREMLINLIINAVDAMPNGGNLTVRLNKQISRAAGSNATANEGNWAIIEVNDSGISIPPSLSERIFEAFYTTKPIGQGSGLGLAMCRQIAARHNGRIEVLSEMGKGTSFRVFLPLEEQTLAEQPVATQPAHATTLRILVVDDDPSIREVLQRILQRAGHHVTHAGSGEEALSQFSAGRYDLLFTDLSLTGMNGTTFLNHARQIDPQIQVVIVTGWGQFEPGSHLTHGAVAVLPKPFSVNQIYQLLSEITGRDKV